MHTIQALLSVHNHLNLINNYYSKTGILRLMNDIPDYMVASIYNPLYLKDESKSAIIEIAAKVENVQLDHPIYTSVVDNINCVVTDKIPLMIANQIEDAIMISIPKSLFDGDIGIKEAYQTLLNIYFSLASNYSGKIINRYDAILYEDYENGSEALLSFIIYGLACINLKNWFAIDGKNISTKDILDMIDNEKYIFLNNPDKFKQLQNLFDTYFDSVESIKNGLIGGKLYLDLCSCIYD